MEAVDPQQGTVPDAPVFCAPVVPRRTETAPAAYAYDAVSVPLPPSSTLLPPLEKNDVVEFIAGAIDRRQTGQGEILDIGAKRIGDAA